tara:strand:+ start:1109 stop:1279 length:171 start_codon:yes stop_codon:yes gene_type:complete
MLTGFLTFTQLTTDGNSHFALFNGDDFEFWKGTIYLLCIFSFLYGSFASCFIIQTF